MVRGTARAEDAQGTPTQSHISPSILVYEEEAHCVRVQGSGFRVERLSSGLGVEFGFAVHVWVHYVGQGFGAWVA